MKNLFVTAAFAYCCSFSLAIADNQLMDRSVDSRKQLEIIDSITIALNEYYIFPDLAKETEKYIRTQYDKKAYRDILSTTLFAQKLTEDLRQVCKDAHLSVEFQPDEYFVSNAPDAVIEEQKKQWYDELAYDNFGFTKVERLAGNVGYIQMRGFYEADWAGPTAIAAMNFLAHCDAIIFDLRLTLGGQPSMIQLLASYFFDKPTQLSSFYVRKGNQEEQFWTHNYVSGPRMVDMKLFILTSRQTPSAAEAFAYDLKQLRRATIIGETTSGAAHPAEEHWFPNLNIVISIPYGRAINPITGTNWEGVGVEPHIQVPAERALLMAHLEALKAIMAECKNEKRKGSLEWARKDVEAQLYPVKMTTEEMKDYVGTYGLRRVYIKGDELFYQREGKSEYHMVPLSNDLFSLEGMEVMHIQFSRDSSGVVKRMISLSEDGPLGSYEKEE